MGTVRLGFATDTQDATGKQITPLLSSKEMSLEELRRTLSGFIGPQLQTPPMFSAKKVGGKRLYKAAREGLELERAPVNIVVHSLELLEDPASLSFHDDGTADFRMRVRCSSGTYVRTLADDIGRVLGVGGHLASLRRMKVGNFDLEEALTLEELEHLRPAELKNCLIDGASIVTHLPRVMLDEEQTKLISNGRRISVTEAESIGEEGFLRLCDQQGRLVAIGERDPIDDLVRPRVVVGV